MKNYIELHKSINLRPELGGLQLIPILININTISYIFTSSDKKTIINLTTPDTQIDVVESYDEVKEKIKESQNN